jgi:hypothetical protein
VNRTTSVVQELPSLGAKTIQREEYPAGRTRVIIGSQKAMIDFQILKSSQYSICIKWAKIIN